MSSIRWLAERRHADRAILRLGVDGERVVARWVGLGELRATRDGREHEFRADPSAAPAAVDKVLRVEAAMLLRQAAGKMVLHASSVVFGDRAVLFLGDSGAGKSTIAASLVQRGLAALGSDDLTPVESPSDGLPWRILPFVAVHSITPTTRAALGVQVTGTGKTALLPVRAATGEPSLHAIVELAFDDSENVRLKPLSGVDALRPLLAQVVRLVIDEPERQIAEIESLTRLVQDVTTVRLVRPRRLDLLHESADRIATLLDHATMSGE